ncbi:MAG TPA: phosphotransferase family protein [Candidatus Binataceae bacterium]|nr:phosphotransferase family protein [Candidatus Binataceae bacterium]
MSDDDFSARLEAALARHTGKPAKVHDLQRLTGGANRTTMLFEANAAGEATAAPQARRQFILQLGSQTFVPVAGILPQTTPAEQARLMIAAAQAGAPAPRVVAILEPADGLGEGYITERVAGETLGARIVRDERFAAARRVMARQCGEILAAIHRIDPAAAPFLMRQDAAEHVAAHRKVVDYYNFRLPALELAMRWAAENAPRNQRPVVLHGDFRTGNMIVGEEGIRCVLDWELAQIGDPMQDLGWLCVRTWRFGGAGPVGGFGSREDLFAAYEKASGLSVDPAHVRFWEAFGNVKWAVDCLLLGTRGVEEVGIERCAIGRRIEEPLWDFFNLIESRNS